MNSTYLFISGPEIIVIMLIVVVIFGPKKIPEIARGLGKGMRQMKEATNDIKQEIKDSAEKNNIDTSITDDINKEIAEVKGNIEEVTKPVRRNR